MIDYEAALDAFVVAQAQVTNGVYHPKTGQLIMEAMIRAVVAAALGDEPLFSRKLACDDRAWQCRQGSHDDYRCCEYTQMWPEVTDDE